MQYFVYFANFYVTIALSNLQYKIRWRFVFYNYSENDHKLES